MRRRGHTLLRVPHRIAGMASRVGDIVVDCADPELLAAFWCAVLGYRELERDETGVAITGFMSRVG